MRKQWHYFWLPLPVSSEFLWVFHTVYSQIHGEVSLSLDVSCYNDQLSLWEPLLEPVMKQEDVYTPWKLVVKVTNTDNVVTTLYIYI